MQKTLRNIISLLSENRVEYAVIGGLANSFYGNPRATQDIDILISCENNRQSLLIRQLERQYTILPKNPLEFIQQTKVLPIKDKQTNVTIDLVFSLIPFEDAAIKKAKKIKIFDIDTRIITLENLIIMKLVSDRIKDIDDVKFLVKSNMEKIDWKYLETKVEELSLLLETNTIMKKFNEFRKEGR